MPSENQAARSYDEVPYDSFPYPQSHPGNLATLATLFGMEPRAIESARILEIGCAAGGNLLPVAADYPEARLIGIDASQKQIAEGKRWIDSLGLSNIELRQQDLMEFDFAEGPFDYIICHGVYSWVPPDVQSRIMEICRQTLAPQGVAYISYNTYPGWYLRRGVREMMGYHARGFDDPQEKVRQARALVDFLSSAVASNADAHGQLLREELSILRSSADSYVFHEHLEDYNEPVFFYQFAERADEHGMRYLSESHLGSMLASDYGDEIQETLTRIAPGIIQMEQYMDFLRNRRFRQTLLCRKEVELERSITGSRAEGFWVNAPLHRVITVDNGDEPDQVTFQHVSGRTVNVVDPAHIAALDHASERWPGDVPVDELIRRGVAGAQGGESEGGESEDSESEDEGSTRETILEMLIELYTSDMLRLHAVPAKCVGELSETPRATPMARQQCSERPHATNQRHQSIGLDDFEREILMRLDGKMTVDEITSELIEYAVVGGEDGDEPVEGESKAEGGLEKEPPKRPSHEQMRGLIVHKLERLMQSGLIVG